MCGLFGLIDYHHTLDGNQKSKILSTLAIQSEVRGTDATGIAYNSEDRLCIYKRPMAAHKLHFLIPNDVTSIMGHTRLTTQGSQQKNYNNHPFYGRIGRKDFALAHNGSIRNDLLLRHQKKLPNTKIQTDSYIAVQLLEHQKSLNLNSLKSMAEHMEGSFTFSILDKQNNFYFVKGDSPLCLFHYPRSGLVLYASTREILCHALKRLHLSLEKPIDLSLSCGDMVKVDPHGKISTATFDAINSLMDWHFSHYVPTYCKASYKQMQGFIMENQYTNDLKSVAKAFGYSPDDVDLLLVEGFTPEEIEEYFYCGEI